MKCAACGNDPTTYPDPYSDDVTWHDVMSQESWVEVGGSFTRTLDSDDANIADSATTSVKLFACGRCGTVRMGG